MSRSTTRINNLKLCQQVRARFNDLGRMWPHEGEREEGW